VASSFHVENFGCRAARADGEAVAALLRSSGAAEAAPAQADVVIVNTCSVTAEADREARAYIRRTHRLNPEARIIATGCYAQRAPEELAGFPGVAAVIGNSHKALAPEIARGLMGSAVGSSASGLVQIAPQVLADDAFAHSFLEAPILPGDQTRPNLKIQEGCSNRCSFCVIPQTRGNSRSLPAPTVFKRVRGFVEAEGKELVLSGINLGRWGRDLDPAESEIRTLAGLVRVILEHTDLPRLRLSSIEPMDWDADLIALAAEFAGTRLARHAHLPLQSGSDSVLRRMHRRYRPWHYAEKVAELLRAFSPALTLGADVMVGFPGETDREFRESYDFIGSLPFGYLHLFPFSPRPGTRACALHAENPVPAHIVEERMAALRDLAAETTRSHRTQFIGAELEAITLHTPRSLAETGRTSALTENFLPVEVADGLPANQLVRIRVAELAADGTLRAVTPGSCGQPPDSGYPAISAEPVLE
jgi:threonylcarbamoyladenosine tRNA methylthiotransferase MtaB